MDLMEKLASLAQRYEELNTLMSQPEVLDDISLLQRYGREHAELEEVVQKYHALIANEQQIAEAQEMYQTSDEPEMRDLAYEELEHLKEQKEHLLEEVRISLLPKDIMDEKNAIVTIQGGAGGDEAALFAGELFRMYSRYADSKRWKIEILDSNETGLSRKIRCKAVRSIAISPSTLGSVRSGESARAPVGSWVRKRALPSWVSTSMSGCSAARTQAAAAAWSVLAFSLATPSWASR